MTRFALPLLAASFLAAPAAAAVQVTSPGPVVELTVSESVEAAPDLVTVSAGVTVPDVRGLPLTKATETLSALGWKVARVERNQYPGQASNTVVLQHPPPGELAPSPGELLLAVAE